MRIIIDSHGLGYRSLYSMSGLSYGNKNTGVIFGFLTELINLAELFNTNQFIFCWDSRQSYRKLIEPTYKENRNEMPPEQAKAVREAQEQFAELRDYILPSMGFSRIYMQTGYEADDLIAWITYRIPDHYVIATGDDDLLQLINEYQHQSVIIYNLKKKHTIDYNDFVSKYGINPDKWSRVKAIGGCVSDNVRGIPGVGPESAIKYINGCLKDGAIKNKIESPEGKRIIEDCMELVHLPLNGYKNINIVEEKVDFYKEDYFYSLNFMDIFRKYGCNSFLQSNNFDKWKKAFKLISGR